VGPALDDIRIYTVEDVAARWDVNHKTVRSMIHRGDLKCFRVGRMIKISEAALAEYEGWTIGSRSIEESGAPLGRSQDTGFADPRRSVG